MTSAVQAVAARGPAFASRGLGRQYGDLAALAPLDAQVAHRELVALVGPNGAGKTTLLAMAAGLLEASHGEVRIDGFPAGSLEARAATSYIPDAPVLYDDLSLNEHLEYVARLHGAGHWQARGPELLERLALERWGEHLPREFSRGMRQKASIALAFIRPFSLLLADEPFDGLDPPSRGVLVELLREACASGAAVIVSTHRTEAVEFADRCIALYDGRIAYDGPPDPAVIAGFGPAAEEAGSESGPRAPTQVPPAD